MKSTIKSLLVIIILISVINPGYGQKIEKIAIFPVDIPMQGTSCTLYPNILNLISGDIVNTLSKKSFVSVIDINASENLIHSLGLYKKYKQLLLEYKTSYTIDYDICALIANKIGASKVIFVSGGFDLQKLIMERSLLYKLDLPGGNPLLPSYRLNVLVALVDPQSGLLIWENTYRKNFTISDFSLPSQYFAENVISIEKIKNFSNSLSGNVTAKIADIFGISQYTEVSGNIISAKSNNASSILPQLPAINTNYLLNNRKNNYKSWIKEKLQ